MKWSSKGIPAPKNWDAAKQLKSPASKKTAAKKSPAKKPPAKKAKKKAD